MCILPIRYFSQGKMRTCDRLLPYKKEYSNGLDLRNKYAHDTCPLDEKTQQYDYWELQKIMVLIILKINEELCLKTLQQ